MGRLGYGNVRRRRFWGPRVSLFIPSPTAPNHHIRSKTESIDTYPPIHSHTHIPSSRQTTMDEKGRALQGRLDFCERNVKALQNGVKGIIKNHQGRSVLLHNVLLVSTVPVSDPGRFTLHPPRRLPIDPGPLAAGPRHCRAGSCSCAYVCVCVAPTPLPSSKSDDQSTGAVHRPAGGPDRHLRVHQAAGGGAEADHGPWGFKTNWMDDST